MLPVYGTLFTDYGTDKTAAVHVSSYGINEKSSWMILRVHSVKHTVIESLYSGDILGTRIRKTSCLITSKIGIESAWE